MGNALRERGAEKRERERGKEMERALPWLRERERGIRDKSTVCERERRKKRGFLFLCIFSFLTNT